VHARPLCRHGDGDDALRRARVEETLGQQLHAGRAGALAHADQDAAVSDHQDVAALELGRTAEAIAPGLVGLCGEQRVVPVDRVEVNGLAPPGGLRHRVDGHTAVHPR
jgi:hypothetical protein